MILNLRYNNFIVTKGGLGRVLGSLMGGAVPKRSDSKSSSDAFTSVPVESRAVPVGNDSDGLKKVLLSQIIANPKQPRKEFDPGGINELAASIEEYDLLQPLIVTPSASGDTYILVAGERRFRALKQIGRKDAPVVIRDADELKQLEISIIENIQRKDLSPIERANSFERLVNEFNLSQVDAAKKLNVSRSALANTIRLLQLPPEAQKSLNKGEITEGHARAILALDNKNDQINLLNQIRSEGLSVRDTEQKVPHKKKISTKDPNLTEIEQRLSRILGTKVSLTGKVSKGKISIDYYSAEELKEILAKISK